jgi:molybdate transport system substrate-binding protein
MMHWAIFSVTAALVLLASGAASAEEAGHRHQLTIGAAPTLKAALHGVVPMFEQEYGVTVQVVYESSQTLRRQIEAGAPIDVFLSSSLDDVEKLHKKGMTLNGGPRPYAKSSLVLIMSLTSSAMPAAFRDMPPNRAARMAVGDPNTSALGDATARVLQKDDPRYRQRFQLVYGQHSEDVVKLVATGQADYGIVYRADAISNGKVRIIDELQALPTGVQFGEAIVSTCRPASLPAAEEFMRFMLSPRIQKLLIRYGFDPIGSSR